MLPASCLKRAGHRGWYALSSTFSSLAWRIFCRALGTNLLCLPHCSCRRLEPTVVVAIFLQSSFSARGTNDRVTSLTIDDKTVSAQTSRPSLRVLTGNMHKGFNVSIDWRTRTSAHLARGAGLQEVFQMVHGQEARTSQVNRQKWARG